MDAKTVKEIIAGLNSNIENSMAFIKAEQERVEKFKSTKEYMELLLSNLPKPSLNVSLTPYSADGTVAYKMKYALTSLRQATARRIAEFIAERESLPEQDVQKLASAIASNFSQKLAKDEDFKEVGVNEQGIKLYALKD